MRSVWVAEQNLPVSSRGHGFRWPKLKVGCRRSRQHAWHVVHYKLRLPIAPIPILSWWGPVLSVVLLHMLSEQPEMLADDHFGALLTDPYRSRIWWKGQWRTLQGGVNTPTMVQHIAGPIYSPVAIPDMTLRLPNLTLLNNLVVVSVTVGSTTTTFTMSDNKGSTYTAGPTANDASAPQKASMFYAPGCQAGIATIKATLSASTVSLAMMATEFYNVQTTTPSDGSNTAVVASGGTAAFDAGSVTTGTSGDLGYIYAIDDGGFEPWTCAHPTQGTGGTLLSAYGESAQTGGMAAGFTVQTASGAIDLSMVITTTGSVPSYIALVQWFKSAAAGTAPSITPRIQRVRMMSIPDNTTAIPKAQIPCGDNLVVVLSHSSPNDMTLVSDSNSNTYTSAAVDHSTGGANFIYSHIWYAANATTGDTLSLSVTWPASTIGITFSVLDITGASTSPFVVAAATHGDQTTVNGNPNILPGTTVAPTAAGQLAVGVGDQDTATCTGVTTGVFLLPTWSTQNEGGTPSGAGDFFTDDAMLASYYTPSGSSFTFSWIFSAQAQVSGVGNWCTAVAVFQGAAGGGAPQPVVRSQAVQRSVT